MRNQFKKMFKKRTSKKLNNKGVTLVELIIAVAILGIVVTPLLHTFVTSARINAKARKRFDETMLAENLMEEFRDATVDDMILKYSGIKQPNGRVEFFNINHTKLSSDIDSKVFVDVFLDPTIYATDNSENLVDLETISASDCAIYSMTPAYDEEVYKIFADNSASANATKPGLYTYKDKNFFEANLDRTLYVSVIKTGQKADGTLLVRVEMNMVYEWRGAGAYLEPENRRYTTKTKELFDNSKTEIALNAIYLMYIPRYAASKLGHADEIRMLNFSNVPTKAFIVRQVTPDDAVNLSEYKTRKSAHIIVIEDNVNTPYTVNTDSFMQIRTNMHEELRDTHSEINPALLNCLVSYRNQTGTQIATSVISEKILNVSTLDGRTLDNSSLRDRIYEMRVELYKEEIIAGLTTKTMLTTMDGTKIE